MGEYGKRKWVKLWCDEMLTGTTRFQLGPVERSVWVDFLLLCGRSRIPGVIAAGETNDRPTGYPRRTLAGMLNIPLKALNRSMDLFVEQERIELGEDDIIVIRNWDKYQSEYERQKPYRQKSGKSGLTDDEVEANSEPSPSEVGTKSEASQDGFVENKTATTKEVTTEVTHKLPPEPEVRSKKNGWDGKGSGEAHGRAHSLALQFWELQGNPERHRKSIPEWEKKIGKLLTQEPEIDPLLTCLFSRELPYWSRAWDKGSPDPMAFLLRKLAVPVEKKGIRQTYDELVSRARAAKNAKRRSESPPEPAAPPAGEPLWDINRMRSACTQVVNGVGIGKAYYEQHKDEYKTLHPDWAEELEWRIYGRRRDSGSAGRTAHPDGTHSGAGGAGGRNAPPNGGGSGPQAGGTVEPA